MMAVLSVFHEHATGWHTFTSPQMPGLFLTGPDEEFSALCAALPSTINALIEAGGRRPVNIQPVDSFRSDEVGVSRSEAKKVLHFMITGLEPAAPETRPRLQPGV